VRRSAAQLLELAAITKDYATATGRDVPAAAQRLAGAFGDPAKGAKELDHELGILNASQLAAIQNFNALGQTAQGAGGALRRAEGSRAGPERAGAHADAAQARGAEEDLGEMFPSKPLDFQAMEGEVAPMSWVYRQRGFEGDARDLQAQQGAREQAAREDRTKALLGHYDKEGTARRTLTSDISFMQGYLGTEGIDPQVARQLAADLAEAKKALDELNGTTRLTAQETRQLVQHAQELDKAWSDQVSTVDSLGNAVEVTRAEYDKMLRAQDDADKAYARTSEQIFRQTQSLEEENRRLREHVESIGLTKEQLEQRRLARDQDTLAALDGKLAMEQVRDGDDAYTAALAEQIRLLRERVELQGQAVVRQQYADQQRAAAELLRQNTADIERTLEHALVAGFTTGGKSGAEILKRELENVLAHAILTPIIRPLLMPISSAIASSLTPLFGGAAAGGALAGGAGAAPMTAEEAFFAGSAGAGAAAFSWMPPVAAAAGLAYAYQSGLGARTMKRDLPIFGKVGNAVNSIFPGMGSIFGDGDEAPQYTVFLRRGQDGKYFLQTGDDGGQAIVHTFDTGLDPSKISSWAEQGPHGGSLEEVVNRMMSMLAPAILPDINQLTAQRDMMYQQVAAFADPGVLGITSLHGFLDNLSVSELSNGTPLDRLASARGLYDKTLGRVRGGDASAIGDLEQQAQTLLGMGRDVYASGGDYEELRSSVTADLKDVLGRQEQRQADLLKDLPATYKQGVIDVNKVARENTDKLLAALAALQSEIARVGGVLQQ
jgi:hypothetical protein